jgi:hypothetical protein
MTISEEHFRLVGSAPHRSGPAPGLFHVRSRLEPFPEEHVAFGVVNRVAATVDMTEPRLIAGRKMHRSRFIQRSEATILTRLLQRGTYGTGFVFTERRPLGGIVVVIPHAIV